MRERKTFPIAGAGGSAGDRAVGRCCRAGRARTRSRDGRRRARRHGQREAVTPRPPGDAARDGAAAGDARRRAMTRTGDGADAVRLLPGHRQPGGSAVPPAPPPCRGVRGGLGRGGLGRGVPVLREGCPARGVLGPRACSGMRTDAGARTGLCMGDAGAWGVRGLRGACTGGMLWCGGHAWARGCLRMGDGLAWG